MSDSWVCALTGVTAGTGNVTQLYPVWASAGVNPFASMTSGQVIRKPNGGSYGSITVQTDGTNGGTIELWDVSGIEISVDVSSAAVITDAQIDAAVTAGKARLIWSQNFTSTAGAVSPWSVQQMFSKGLAARYAGSGTCSLNIGNISGGFIKTTSPGT